MRAAFGVPRLPPALDVAVPENVPLPPAPFITTNVNAPTMAPLVWTVPEKVVVMPAPKAGLVNYRRSDRNRR